MSLPLPPVAVLVSHQVADYDAWKAVFDGHRSSRMAASALGHVVNRDVDNTNTLHLYIPASDVERTTAFLGSDELRAIMGKAGVVGAPTITLMTPMSADFIQDEMLPGIIVRHAVEDYDRWRAAYDAFDEDRQAAGIVGHAVNQVRGQPNQLVIYHQARELDTLRAFVDSNRLKEVMQEAGVTGPPEISFVQTVDIGEY